MAVPVLEVPRWGVLARGWSFLSALPGGGMAVLAEDAEQVLLLDEGLAPTATVTIAGPRPWWPWGIGVCVEAGLVAVVFADGLRVFELASGRLVYRLGHRAWPVAASPAWTSSGRLLWVVVPTDTPAVDQVVAIDPGTWTVLGRLTVRAPSTNQAYYQMLPTPTGDQVGVLGVLADSDGYYLAWPRWDGNALVSPAELRSGHQVTDVDPDGHGFVAVTGGCPNEVVTFDLATGQPTERLGVDTATDNDRADDYWDEVFHGPSPDHLIATTGEARLVVLRRAPLRVVAQLSLAGYRYVPFDGSPIDTAAQDDDAMPLLGQVQRWTGRRLITPNRRNMQAWDSPIYDLSTLQLPG